MRYICYVVFLIASASSYAETYNEPIAIVVSPTGLEIQRAKRSFTEEEYSNWVDHGAHYSYQIQELLKMHGSQGYIQHHYGYTFFVKNKEYKLSLLNREYSWSVVMFNGEDAPCLYEFPYDPSAESYYAKISNK